MPSVTKLIPITILINNPNIILSTPKWMQLSVSYKLITTGSIPYGRPFPCCRWNNSWRFRAQKLRTRGRLAELGNGIMWRHDGNKHYEASYYIESPPASHQTQLNVSTCVICLCSPITLTLVCHLMATEQQLAKRGSLPLLCIIDGACWAL